MQQVLLIGASGGIGAALAHALEARGASVTRLSRSVDGLELREPETIEALLAPLAGPYDAMILATGALHGAGHRPEKSLRALTPEAMAEQFAINCIGPAMILRHAPRLLPRRGRALCAVLSARVGSIGDNRAGGWHSYRAAKAALNQVVRGAAIELARSHPGAICVALHPGTVATPFTADYRAGHPAVAPDVAAANLLAVLDGLTPAESGGFFDWRGERVPW